MRRRTLEGDPERPRHIFATAHPLYLAEVEKKGRTKSEPDADTCWLTGFDQDEVEHHLAVGATFADFFAVARIHPNAAKVTGVDCAVRVEAVEDPPMHAASA